MSNIKELSPREGVRLVFVEVHNDQSDFRFEHSGLFDKYILVYKSKTIWEKYGKECWNWKVAFDKPPVILGIATELSEEVVRELVDSWDSATGGGDYQDYYRNYEIETDENYMHLFHFTDPLPSFASFLCLHGIGENWLVLRVDNK